MLFQKTMSSLSDYFRKCTEILKQYIISTDKNKGYPNKKSFIYARVSIFNIIIYYGNTENVTDKIL